MSKMHDEYHGMTKPKHQDKPIREQLDKLVYCPCCGVYEAYLLALRDVIEMMNGTVSVKELRQLQDDYKNNMVLSRLQNRIQALIDEVKT